MFQKQLKMTAKLILLMLIWTLQGSTVVAGGADPNGHSDSFSRINYGTIFRTIKTHFIPTDSIHHLYFSIEFPEKPDFPQMPRFPARKCDVLTWDDNHRPPLSIVHQMRVWRHFEQKAAKPLAEIQPEVVTHYPDSAMYNNVTYRAERMQINRAKQVACLEIAGYIKQFVSRYEKFRKEILKSYDDLYDLLQGKVSSKTRNKRAVLGFMAPLFNSIFGIATEPQVNRIQENIQRLYKNQQNSVNSSQEIRNDLISLQDATNKRIANLWTGISELNVNARQTEQWIRNLTHDTNEYFENVERKITDIYSWIRTTSTIHDNANLVLIDAVTISDQIDNWRQAIVGLAGGLIPERLIRKSDMISSLTTIKSWVNQRNPDFRLIHDELDVQYYYLNKLATSFVKAEEDRLTLIVHVGVPLSTLKSVFKIYQMITRPVPLMANDSETLAGYTNLDKEQIPDYIAVSESGEFYNQLSQSDYEYCISRHDTTCPILATIHDVSKLNCAGALFFNYHEAVQDLCVFNVYNNDDFKSYIEYVTEGKYLVATPDFNYQVMCPEKARNPQKGFLSLVTLPCACEIQTTDIRIPASLAMCNDKTTDVQLHYPINAAQLMLLDIDDFDLNVPITKLPIISDKMKSNDIDLRPFIHRDKKFSINLAKKTAINQDGKHDLLAPKPPVNYDNGMNWDYIYLITSLVLSVSTTCGLLVLTALVYIKWKTVIPLLLLLTQRTERMPLAEAKPTVPLSVLSIDNTILIVQVSILASALLLFLTNSCVRHYRAGKFRKQTSIELHSTGSLVISDGQIAHVFELFTIQACLLNVKITKLPAISRINVTFNAFQKPKLQIEWAEPFTYKFQERQFNATANVDEYIDSKTATTIQRFLHDINVQSLNYFSTFRMQCKCQCETSRQLIYDITKKVSFQDTSLERQLPQIQGQSSA